MNTIDMRILRWIKRKIRNDRIINEMFWRATIVKPFTTHATQSRSRAYMVYAHVTTKK